MGPFGIKLRRGADSGRLVISQAVDPLDGDDVTVYHVKDRVSADAEPVVPAPVESLSWIRIAGQWPPGQPAASHSSCAARVASISASSSASGEA
jgi:hypothetical protein